MAPAASSDSQNPSASQQSVSELMGEMRVATATIEESVAAASVAAAASAATAASEGAAGGDGEAAGEDAESPS